MSSGVSLFAVPSSIITASAIYARVSSVMFFGTSTGGLYRCNLSSTPNNYQTIQLPVSLSSIQGIAVNGQFIYVSVPGHIYRIDVAINTPLFSYHTADQSTIVVTNGFADVTPAGFNPTGGVATTASNDVFAAVNTNVLISMRGTIVNTIYTGTASMRLINLAVDPDEQ